jgi:predicted transcriptional regulator
MNTHPEPLEVERLIPEHQRHTPERRRVSVAEHERFRADIAASLADQQPDPIDDALADPVLDHLPSYQSKKKTARVLGILDQLNREGRK